MNNFNTPEIKAEIMAVADKAKREAAKMELFDPGRLVARLMPITDTPESRYKLTMVLSALALDCDTCPPQPNPSANPSEKLWLLRPNVREWYLNNPS